MSVVEQKKRGHADTKSQIKKEGRMKN